MKKIYAEIGFGNKSFFSTEIEIGERESRIPKLILPKKIDNFYIRIWILKTVFVLSTRNGFFTKHKDKNKLKILFGIGGTD